MSDVGKMESKEGCRGRVCAVTAVDSRDDTKSSTFPGSTWYLPVFNEKRLDRRHTKLILC